MLSQHVSLIDTHCHLDMAAYQDDLEMILERAAKHRISHIITIGIDLTSSRKAIELAGRMKSISATIGIHPHDISTVTQSSYDSLAELADLHRDNIVAYGEIGLDYVKNYSDPADQRRHFANQLALADELQLPVIIHDREAHEDTLKILKQASSRQHGGVMHCFSGDYSFARKVLDLGFHISIPGVVTFKNATALQDVARRVPLESLLLETDGPFLSPHPHRGKRNEPMLILHTAQCVANLREIHLDDLAQQTTRNAQTLFGLTLSQDTDLTL